MFQILIIVVLTIPTKLWAGSEYGLDAFDEISIPTESIERAPNTQFFGKLEGYADYNANFLYELKTQERKSASEGIFGRSRSRLDLNLSYNQSYRRSIKLKVSFGSLIHVENEETTSVDKQEYRNRLIETEMRETYVTVSPVDFLDLSVGRQIVSWGKSNVLLVNDVVNPRDNREFATLSIESIRLATGMAKLDLFNENWGVSAILIPEIRQNKNPKFGDNFYPSDFKGLVENKPASNIENPQFAFALSGSLGPLDLSFYKSRLYSKSPVARATDAIVYGDGASLATNYELFYDLLDHEGMSTSLTEDKFAFNFDLARFTGLSMLAADKPNERIDLGSSVEWRRTDTSMLSLEFVKRFSKYKLDLPEYLRFTQPREYEYALSFSEMLLRNKLQVEATAVAFGLNAKNGGFSRFTANYNWNDSLSIYTRLINYYSGDDVLFQRVADNDQIILGSKISF